MSLAKAAPINPETEITREEIAKLAGTSHSKVLFATYTEKWRFPKPVRQGPLGKILYDRKAVQAWLAKNDLKTIVFTEEERRPMKKQKPQRESIDRELLMSVYFGTQRQQFEKRGRSTRVHVPERNDCEKPHSALSRFSHNAEHRCAIGAFL